jgi:hypothetical protein
VVGRVVHGHWPQELYGTADKLDQAKGTFKAEYERWQREQR